MRRSASVSIRATVHADLRLLEHERDPLLIEHMVSDLLGFALNLDRHAEAEFQRRLRAALVKRSSPAALLYTERIADQAPSGWDVRSWLDELRDHGARAPEWESRPQLAFVGAWKGSELLGDQDLIILGFQYENEPAESFQLMIDHNLELIKDAISLLVPPPELIAAWHEGTEEIRFRPVDSQQASDEISAPLAHSDALWLDPPWSDDFRAHRGLLRTRLRLLPAPAGIETPEPPSEELRREWVAEFMRSPEAANLRDHELGELITGRLVDFRIDLGDGEVFRWSPIVVEMLLADWYPRKTLPDDGEVEHVPEVLRAWIRHAGQRRKLPESLIGETVDAVAKWVPEFENGMADVARFGPAKSMLVTMKAEGVDVSDSAAVERWLNDFNQRSVEERAAIISPRS